MIHTSAAGAQEVETSPQAQAEPVPEMVVTSREQFGRVTYRGLSDFLKVMDQVGSSGHHLRLAFKIQYKGGSIESEPVQMWADYDGKEDEIESTADGIFLIPYRADWEAADAKLVTSPHSGTLEAVFLLEVTTDPGQTIPYAELREGAKLVGRAIREFVRPAKGFSTPDIDELDFLCGPLEHCQVSASIDGGDALNRNERVRPVLKFSSKLDRRNPVVRIAATAEDGTPGRIYALPLF
ncbi:hypothetical protein UCD39_17115 [Nitrospirillum sp. BR 11752]|uniref:hypothetical protein n=1 Tax=Nitrospirillum sp. BR 11752 TaxID=3104293 RepID=UPI002EB1F8F1|nr:hypothetical protein [Nitrospirillum sp. BR 11752]